MSKTTFIATGDLFITRHLPEGGYEGFKELSDCIKEHDVKFSNLEMTFHDHEGAPAATSGGTWAMTEPEMLDDVLEYGFNLFNTANNHSGDYGEGGVVGTIKHLRERKMTFSGTGRNLGEASRPCYLEMKDARVALISVSASFNEGDMAGGQSPDMQGRAGLNPLRHSTRYHVTQEYFDMVTKLAELTKANALLDFAVRNGYMNALPASVMPLGRMAFVLDEKNFTESVPNETDMKRIIDEIHEAKKQADIVLVSFHAHETDGDVNNVPAMFLELFSRRCVDEGADVIIGHGPHELRGIEIYKDKPIFYSIGNFLFETETVALQPYDAYINKKMPIDTKVGAYMSVRSKNDTVGYGMVPEIWKAVMAAWTMEDGKVTQIQLYPIDLQREKKRSQKGVPIMDHDEKTLEYLQSLSDPYGTKIRIENGVGYIDL